LVTGCSDIIAIELIPTRTPTPTPTATPTPTPEPVVIDLAVVGMPVRIVAPKIGLDAPVVEMGWVAEERRGQIVGAWVIPDNEAGWHRNSAWPGQGSNIVISGHNASLGGQIFAEVEALEIGDLVTVWSEAGGEFTYQVQEKTIVRTLFGSQDALDFVQASMASTRSERLTLITCWPNWTNTHRLVIVAEPYPG